MDMELQLPVRILIEDGLHCSRNCPKCHEGSCVAESATGELLWTDGDGRRVRSRYCIKNAQEPKR